MDSWKFREELLESLNQWHLILAFILIGALIGYVISYVVPAPYQAVSEFYIGIDVERVNHLEYIIPLAEEEPLNLDDYKNWQLKQVAGILTSDSVFNKTLSELHQANSESDELTLQDLRKAADIYWYDTGVWRLEVVLPQKEQAVEVADAWLNAGYGELARLLAISKTGNAIDQEIWSINLAISELRLQRVKYLAISSSCTEWITKLGGFSGDSPLDKETYSEIKTWVQLQIETASFPLETFFDIPGENEPVATFTEWYLGTQDSAEKAIIQLESEKLILEADRDEILPDFHQYLDDSLGLSANLVLLPNTSETGVRQIYSTGQYTIGGSLLGLFSWIILTAVRISSRKENHGN